MNVPDADALVRLMSAWSSLPRHKFNRAYPFFDADRQRTIEEYDLIRDDRAKLEATALLFSDYADNIYAKAIEAQRADTPKSESVADESAVAKPFAQKDRP